MSYYANGYGYFEVKNTDTIVDDFVKAMTAIPDETDTYEVDSMFATDGFIIFNCHGDYNEEVIDEVLYALAPLIKDGALMEFEGEDGSLWAFELEDGRWSEKQGRVTYDDTEHLQTLLANALQWISEQEDDNEVFKAVLKQIGLTEKEIAEEMITR